MSLFIFLDTGPLGAITNPKRPPQTVQMLLWAAGHLEKGNTILVPAVADFEVRRELLRLKRPSSIATLNAWCNAVPERYLPLTDSILKNAAQMWADIRNQGLVTADPKELDCDALIAAQVLDYMNQNDLSSDDVVIATSNVGHLSRFVPAKLWDEIE